MAKFNYTPDGDLKVHQEGAIKLICQSFRSHENGLPEWCKNSSDAYIRDECEQDRRVIAIVSRNGKGEELSSISCLDFVRMTSSQIENKFRQWATKRMIYVGNS